MVAPNDLDKLERSPDDRYGGRYEDPYGGQYGSDDPGHYKKTYGSDDPKGDGKTSPPTGASSTAPEPSDLAQKEKAPIDPHRLGRGYTGSPDPDRSNKVKSLMKNRKLLLLGGIPSLLILGVVLFFTLLFPSLKIPQLAFHIQEYRLVRLTRTFYKQAAILATEKIAVDAADGSADSLTRSSKTGVLLASLRPQAVIDNMKAGGILGFDTERGPLGTQKITAVKIKVNGQEKVIEVPKKQFGKPIANYKNRLRFASQINSSVHDALRGNSYLVRSRASKLLLNGFGWKFRWWENKGAKYFGLDQDKADQLALQEATEKVRTTPKEGGSKISGVKDAAKESNQAIDDCQAKAACAKKWVQTGELPPEVHPKIDGVVNRVTGQTAFSGILNFLNPIYAVGMPVCIVYDGSVQASDAFVNSQNIAATKTFLAVATAADQQKKGDVTAQAVGAFNRRVGDIANSIPEKIARGEKVNTSAEVSPQAARSGEFTVFDALFPPGATATAANFLADKLCPTITNTGFNTVLAVANVGAVFVVGPAEAGAGAAAKGLISRIASRIAEQFTTSTGRAALKNTGKKYATSTAKVEAGTQGATYLARMLVLAEMGAFYNGTSKDNLATEADAGGVTYANEMQRQQQFGRPLTTEEVRVAKIKDSEYLAQQKASQSTFEKYFALSNPDSVAANLAVQASELKLSSLASFFLNIPKIIGSIFSPLNHFLNPLVGAADDGNTDYNVVQWGWSPDEEALIDSDPSFSLLENAQIVDDPANKDLVYGAGGIVDTYNKCFTSDIGTLLTDGSVVRDAEGNLKDEGNCSPTQLGPNNPDFPNKMVFRWRLDQSYQNTLNELLSIQNPEASVATASNTTTPPPTTAGACPAGSDSVGQHDGYDSGSKISLTLCAISNLKINDFTSGQEGAESTPGTKYYIANANSRALIDVTMAPKVLAMVDAAKAEGVNLVAFSSFRTHEHQKILCGADTTPCPKGAYAAPGHSRHQRGFAIDFVDANKNSTAKCRTDSRGYCSAPGDPTWEWLTKNASKFGYQQLKNESWHWSPDGR